MPISKEDYRKMVDILKKRCPGCGAYFQEENPEEAGYLPPGKTPDGKVLCRRCFQMRHYGVMKKASIKDRAIKSDILSQIKRCSAVLMVVDISQFEISSEALNWAVDMDKPVFVVVNKCDVLKRWMTTSQISKWVSERLHLDPNRIISLSANDRRAVANLRHRIEDTFSPGETVLLLGTTNVGKSTLLSGLSCSDVPTISTLPGTTLGIIEGTSKNGNITYIDAPGLKESNPWLPRMCPKCLTALIPHRSFSSCSATIKPGQVIALGGLGWLRVDGCGDRGWIKVETFVPEKVTVHTTNVEKFKALCEPFRGDLMSPPCESCWSSLQGPNYLEHSVTLHVNQDLVIPGCGWITVRSGNFLGSISLPQGVDPVVRPCLVPSEAIRKTGRSR